MTAPFVPSTDLSAAIPALVQKEQEPVAHTIPAVPGEPRPVAPAEEIGVPPAKALDAVASEKGLLEKAREATMPVSHLSSKEEYMLPVRMVLREIYFFVWRDLEVVHVFCPWRESQMK
jgi:hypothetical protein